eukprot:COSAG05_NODE_521_length_9023_cov_12.169655_9_plen_56_part_00
MIDISLWFFAAFPVITGQVGAKDARITGISGADLQRFGSSNLLLTCLTKRPCMTI